MGVTAADFDSDGWDDIYVANDRTENFLFHNKHDGTFEEIANDSGTAFGQNGESTSSMGPGLRRLRRPRRARPLGHRWPLQPPAAQHTAKLAFDDIGAANGVSQANAQYVSWGTGVYDFDNDGLLDILIFHGGLIHLIPQEHTLFRGLGNGKFEDVSREAGPVLSDRTVARGACFADYDNDGKVDAFLVNLGAKGTLLHNVSTNTGHWIAIKLEGHKEQPRRHRRARRSLCRRQALDAGARRRLRLSLAERRTDALRLGPRNRSTRSRSIGPAAASRHWRSVAADRDPDRRGAASDPNVGRHHAGLLGAARLVARRCAFARACAWPVARGARMRKTIRRERLTYASPVEMLFSPDGARLYVLCQGSDEMRVLDATTYEAIKSIHVGPRTARFFVSRPTAHVCLSPTPGTTRSPSSTRQRLKSLPHGRSARNLPALSKIAAGKYLFVANRISNDVAVLDAQTGEE